MPATEQTWRDLKLMHVVFGISGVVMLVTTVWMLAADHTREWKGYQRKFREVEAWTTEARITAVKTGAYEAGTKELEAAVAASRLEVPSRELVDQFVAELNEHADGRGSAAIEQAYEAFAAEPTEARRAALIEQMQNEIDAAKVEENNRSRRMKFARADFDVVRSRFEAAVGVGAGQPELDRLQSDVDRVKAEVDKRTLEYQDTNSFRKQLEATLAEIVAPVTDAEKALADHRSEIDRLEKARFQQEWKLGDRLLSMPIIDAFGRPLKINQIWLPELTFNNNFRDVARFDRCMTCHQGIDKTAPGSAVEPAYVPSEEIELSLNTPSEPPSSPEEGEEPEISLRSLYGFEVTTVSVHAGEVAVNVVEPRSLAARANLAVGDVILQVRDVRVFSEAVVEELLLRRIRFGESVRLLVRRGVAQPFASHPRLDLFVGSLSPHKVADFGCTICHEGQGSSTSFQWASHTPNTLRQMEDWRRDHGWFSNHHWIYPMYPDRFAESTCLKCHHAVTELEPSERFPEPPAPKVVDGFQLVKDFGCFGCHEINGWEGPQLSVGPDLRTEPMYFAAAQQLLHLDPELTDRQKQLAREVIAHPEQTQTRKLLAELVKYGDVEAEGEPVELEPAVERLVSMLGEDNELPGRQRRVGPSLRYLASKVEFDFLFDWIREPKHFRPTTKMPQFFGLWDHFLPVEKVDEQGQVVMQEKIGPHGEVVRDSRGRPVMEPVYEETEGLKVAQRYEPVEIYALSHYLLEASQPFEYLDRPARVTADPSAERGKRLFEQRGCLACHQHEDFPGATEGKQGPDLSRMGSKLVTPEGGRWLYTWLREPMRYHTRTVMPNLFLDPIAEEVDGEQAVTDPAADIAAFLLDGGERWEPKSAPPEEESLVEPLDELAFEYLTATFTERQARRYLENGIPTALAGSLKGDELLLVGEGEMTLEKKLGYVGRRTLNKYGCTGCHDVPGHEDAKPIGTGLADWGRKDTAQLAFEQIVEYLHQSHGGEGPGHGHDPAHESLEEAESIGFFMHAIETHHREGFAWQKLREPRSYDFRKTENKSYNDRLRMPQFPFDQQQIESIVTFVLGLVADPPASQYVYVPDERRRAIVEGQDVLEKYNCGGCHTMEMETWQFSYDPDMFPDPLPFNDYHFLMPHFSPAELAASRETDLSGLGHASVTGMPVVDAEGEPLLGEDDDGNPLYYFTLWENTAINGQPWVMGGAEVEIAESQLAHQGPPRGGFLARYLFPTVLEEEKQINPNVKDSEAWSWLPPPLIGEGKKVQSNWLYEFLLDPYPIRPAVVLRMPKFNMSKDEARKLVNYFAAKDNANFPFEFDARTRGEHLAAAEEAHPGRLEDALRIVTNGNYCIKCHHVGDYVAPGSPKALAPNLDQVHSRLRPDFLRAWIANPKRLLPYTGMPVNFPENQPADQSLFAGSSLEQIDAVVDLLLNYRTFMSGRTSIQPMIQEVAPADQAAGGGGQ